jgi:hypothetical protein
MILKKSGITFIQNLHTIVLFPVDCNYVFKHIGRCIMSNAEWSNALASEQYGSHKRHRATNLATNKALSYDLFRQLRRPGAVCSNDAKSYDLIGHTTASLAMLRMGVTSQAVDCMFTTIQEAAHQVQTGFGDSGSTYGGTAWLIPIHGIGQGNGVGPAIWAVVSTPLLNILREHSYGLTFITPVSRVCIHFAGFAFVDDTDLLQMLQHGAPADCVRLKLQEVVDCWEGVLSATAGAIVPDKTYWYLTDFHWQAGSWRYKTIQESLGAITVKDIAGQRKTLRRCAADEAMETLGIFLAPSGSLDSC